MFHISDAKQQKVWTTILRLGVALLTGVFLASPAAAACSFKSGNSTGTATIALPPNLSAPHDAAVGTVVYDSGWIVAGPTSVYCTGSTPMTYGYTSAMTAVPGYTNIYQTGVNGIGIKAAWSNTPSGPANIDAGTMPMLWPATQISFNGNGSYGPMGVFRVQLIVTGPVSPGTFNLPTALAQANYGSLDMNDLVLTNNNVPISAPACSVQNSSIAVSVPLARASALPNIGSTTGDTGFNISLNCSGPAAIAVTLSDASEPGNTSNTLSLSKTSTAGGVGYQITHDSTVVGYGPDSSVAGNLNQFRVGSVMAAGTVNIPLTVRYVRTGKLLSGTADANATFTMSYQ